MINLFYNYIVKKFMSDEKTPFSFIINFLM